MKIFEVAGVGKLHGLTVMSLDAFVKDDEKEVEEAVEGSQKHKVAVTVSDPNHSAVSQRGETRQRICSVTADGREQACDTAINWYKKQGYRVHDHNYVGTVEDTVKEGVMSDLHLQFADVYDELAPGIEKHKDSFKAGQLYDALEAVAEKNGAVREFKRMMMSARNSAHQDYDTNPGGFENWFWYLPFGDELGESINPGVAEGLGKDIKRLATGKDVKSRAGQEIAKSQDASMKGDNKTSKKHFDRYDKLDKLANRGQGVDEGESTTQKYEMMMRNGQVKKFIAKDDADAKRIAAGHGAKSVIKLKGGVPAGKVSEQGVAEEASPMIKPPSNRFDNKKEAFTHAKTHGGKVFRSTYIDPNTGNKNITFVVKKEQGVAEVWSQKYKSSINCSHPKGFSQKAHCAGKKKHTESMMTMEATCPDCGMCESHGSLNEIAKGAKDSNGYTKCWPGKHAEGTKKGRNGGQVRNCVPNESQGVAEAPGDFGLGANYRAVPDAEMQDLMGRSKNKTKTKRDKYDYPYIHGSNIEVKDEAGKTFDTEALKKSIMVRPASILGQNAKMQHSETGEEAIFDIGLPALKGLAVNEKTGEFVVVNTCPGAGECKTFCYAMKGSYVMFKAVSMGLARMLNFLLNDPTGFANKLNAEITAAKAKMAKKNAKVVVRWHDAGDFFSPEYLDMAYGVANANPDVGFYAYTKLGDVATGARPKNFNMNFSGGALSSQEKKIDFKRVKHSKVVPKDMFFDLIARDGNNLKKDAKGRMQFASPANLEQFKSTMAQKYAIDRDSILTYDEMMKTPVGDTPKWNTIVMPGDGDNSANRNDVVGSYLLFH